MSGAEDWAREVRQVEQVHWNSVAAGGLSGKQQVWARGRRDMVKGIRGTGSGTKGLGLL
jgi:hypothetical protein